MLLAVDLHVVLCFEKLHSDKTEEIPTMHCYALKAILEETQPENGKHKTISSEWIAQETRNRRADGIRKVALVLQS